MHFRLVICIITGHCSAHKQMRLQAQRKVNLRQMPRMSSSSLVQCALQARHLYHHWTLQCSQANATTSSKDSQPQTNASNVIILFSAMHFRLVICIITGHCSAHKQMQLQAQRTVNLRQMPRMSSSCLVQCALQARTLQCSQANAIVSWKDSRPQTNASNVIILFSAMCTSGSSSVSSLDCCGVVLNQT